VIPDLTAIPPDQLSVAEKLAILPEAERNRIRDGLTQSQREALVWDWDFWSRPEQKAPSSFSTWVIVTGRGTGKSRTLTEWLRRKGPAHREGLIIGANPRDVRDVLLEGKRSGILQICPPWERPVYEPTKLLLRWPNGAVTYVRSAEDPGSIRGLSVEYVLADELVKWRFLQETWDQSRLALREGRNPQTVVATTPIPNPLIKKLVSSQSPNIVVAPRTSTYRNYFNLSTEYIEDLIENYEGTRLGDQEIHGMILEDTKGALWTHEMIEGARWTGDFIAAPMGLLPDVPLRRKVVGVDPSGTAGGDECGIVVAATDGRRPPCGYVLNDLSMKGTPDEWSRVVVKAYFDYDCEAVVGEVNFGADMVAKMIRDVPAENGYPSGETVRFEPVRAAPGQSKYVRAVPISGLYEQNLRGFRRIYHVGVFKDLEGELTTWVAKEAADMVEIFPSKWSPGRMDAAVWATSYLLVLNRRVQGRSEGEALRSASIA
jgi:phage terminase large subunit-like protein